VVGAGIVEVDRLLDQPEAQLADVEVSVPDRVGPDQRDVVEALEGN